MFGRSHIMLVT